MDGLNGCFHLLLNKICTYFKIFYIQIIFHNLKNWNFLKINKTNFCPHSVSRYLFKRQNTSLDTFSFGLFHFGLAKKKCQKCQDPGGLCRRRSWRAVSRLAKISDANWAWAGGGAVFAASELGRNSLNFGCCRRSRRE